MNFTSDNAEGWAPEILEALARANDGPVAAYGDDPLTARVGARFNELFEREVAVYLVATGTAANSLAFATLSPPWGAIFVHEAAHVQVDECGAPEFFTGGAKLLPLPGEHGKLDPETVTAALATCYAGCGRHAQPCVLGITQATECGNG